MVDDAGDEPGAPGFHWDGPLPAPDFVMVPKLVHRAIMRHLSGAEFKVFYSLLAKAYEWGNGNAELSIAQLIEQGGVGRGSVQRAVAALEDYGLIEVIHHQSAKYGFEPNTYRVLVTDDPRYVDRTPMTKMGIGYGNNGDRGPQDGDSSRARSSKYKNQKEESVPSSQRYTGGRYGVCAECGQSPHDPECALATGGGPA